MPLNRSAIVPMLFVATTTATTGYYEITGKFWKMTQTGAALRGWLNIGLTLMLLVCAAVILSSAFMKWVRVRNPRADV